MYVRLTMEIVVFVFVLFVSNCDISAKEVDIQCKNEMGKAVEWFAIYKLPKYQHSENGLKYLYMDDQQTHWKISKWQIDDPNSAVARSLESIYLKEKPDSLFYASYNDEWPEGHKSCTRGHTKGVFVGNLNSGLWLVHSVPRYPSRSNTSYAYPHSGREYGQSLLCMSLLPSQFDSVGIQWLYNYPYVYDYKIPSWFGKKFPNLYAAITSHHVTKLPWYSIRTLNGSAGTHFHSFSKAGAFHKDLYDALVAPALNSNLWTETWQNGIDYLGPYCKPKYTVRNIKRIRFAAVGMELNSTHDHSKWAISSDAKRPWICIGDINRMTSQFHRGGGTVCMNNKYVWKAYYDLVVMVDHCTHASHDRSSNEV